MPDLHFLFLQGMPSAFFSRLARGLEQRGCRTTGVNLCMGDRLFWRGQRAVDYRGTLEEWQAFIDSFLAREAVSDLVLLGEQRSYHRAAIAAAQARGIRVTVTDFGYLRPDWITLERDGMTGSSRFPKDLAVIRELAGAAPAPDPTPRYADSALRMALGDLAYNFCNLLFWWRYPHYQQSDRRPHPLRYFPAVGWRLLKGRAGASRTRRRVNALLAGKASYFILPLQLEHDFQIVAYSPFPTLLEPLRIVIGSFAAHCARGTRLVIKLHPWDPGSRDWRKIVADLAREHGVSEYVDYLDGGDLNALLRRARGMVTVNSTSGLRALQLGCPVKVLGEAIYDVEGLSFQGTLDDFWTQAAAPDPANVRAFVGALAVTIQLRGVFFSEPGLSAADQQAVERLHAGKVGPRMAD
jgi:capsular polysaccharide export protein